jgi:DNA mismatch endonuclease (patch repair protein)
MSRIRSKDTKPEMIVRKYLHSKGFRYKLHDSKLPGKPDIVLPKYKTVIFIHGCFWHGHQGCKYFVLPKNREKWWKDKIEKNKDRDMKVINEIYKIGWNIITIWECELKENREKTLTDLIRRISE